MENEWRRRRVLGLTHPSATLDFLEQEFLPPVVTRLNRTNARRRKALYGGDQVPENERNLTDVRTRMGLLLEYEMGAVATAVLEEWGLDDLFFSNVVANRFPDLEVRDQNGSLGIRIEVKCLQTVAEEKAANFSTLKKDLKPKTDYVVVFFWDWLADAEQPWDRAPRIAQAFVFHASSLAELRDCRWLGNPPNNLGGGYQGFDLRFAVNCRDGRYAEERGNFGKLLRIWIGDPTYDGPFGSSTLRRTITTFLKFEDYAVWSGFEAIAQETLRHWNSDVVPMSWRGGTAVGFSNGKLGIVLGRRIAAKDLLEAATRESLATLVVVNDRYGWTKYAVSTSEVRKIESGKKPKHLTTRLLGS